jgi:hypothetical protein
VVSRGRIAVGSITNSATATASGSSAATGPAR